MIWRRNRRGGDDLISPWDPARAKFNDDRSALEIVIKLLIVAAAIAVLVEFIGVPHLRTSYRHRGPSDDPMILTARYWSITGSRDVSRFEMGDDMPLLTMFTLDRSLLSYGGQAISELWRHVVGVSQSDDEQDRKE